VDGRGRSRRRVRLASAAVGSLLLLAGCGGNGGPRNAGIVWGGQERIEGANVDGSGRHFVAPDWGDTDGDPAWSRDGRVLAWYARNSDSVEIHVLWPKTKAQRVLSSDWRSPSEPKRSFAYILEPSWAPDGDHIAVADSWNFVDSEIRIVSVSTKRWTSVTRPVAGRADRDPAWSPDGKTIAFTREHASGGPAIFLVGSDGHGLRRLTSGSSPSWSPDGASLAFAFADSIYRIGADGRGRIRLVSGLGDPAVQWSPDSRKLLYGTLAGRASELWVMNSDGTNRSRVLRTGYFIGFAWQPG